MAGSIAGGSIALISEYFTEIKNIKNRSKNLLTPTHIQSRQKMKRIVRGDERSRKKSLDKMETPNYYSGVVVAVNG